MSCAYNDTSWNEWFPKECSFTNGIQSREWIGEKLDDNCVGVQWRNCRPVNFDETITEYPCNVPINFNIVCPSACKMYEPPWASEIRGDSVGYCAAFYDPSNKVDCSPCGTMKLLSGPINNLSSDPNQEHIDNTPKTPKISDWKENVTSKVDKLSNDTKQFINKLIKDIMS